MMTEIWTINGGQKGTLLRRPTLKKTLFHYFSHCNSYNFTSRIILLTLFLWSWKLSSGCKSILALIDMMGRFISPSLFYFYYLFLSRSILTSFIIFFGLVKMSSGYQDMICVYYKHPIAGWDKQYQAPETRSRYTTPFNKITI